MEYSRKYEGDSPSTPNPEETAVILIRSGVPEAAVKVCHKHLTISLSNSTFRIYREPSGCGSGSIRIRSPGTSPVIHLDISSQALADLTLELDAALDDVNAVMASLKERIKEEDLRRQVKGSSFFTLMLYSYKVGQVTLKRGNVRLAEPLIPASTRSHCRHITSVEAATCTACAFRTVKLNPFTPRI